MIKVTLIGQGNVSHHLARAFRQAENVKLVETVNSRKEFSTGFLSNSDVCIIAVSDNAIRKVASKIRPNSCLLVHTSGAVALNSLSEENRRGVFYPAQTLSKSKEINFTQIPLCIEAESEKDLKLLRKLAELISGKVYEISSDQRRMMHLAAVFVNNFTNHIYHIATNICVDNDLPFDILKPLIAETADKINHLTPFEAQTGPARRNDTKTIKSHLELLKNPDYKKIYSQLSESILKTYGEKL